MRRKRPGLHRCRFCHGGFVVPVDWDSADDDHWQMVLRCPDCETYREVVVDNDAAREYELQLERGAAEIASALKRLDRLHMIDLLDRFVAALQRDLIDAADFASR